jgi:hypothetical protein
VLFVEKKTREVSTLPGAPACLRAGLPAYSAEGDRLAFACVTAEDAYSLHVLALDQDEPRSLGSQPGRPRGLAWDIDSRALIVADDDVGGRLWRKSFMPGGVTQLPFGVKGSGITRSRNAFAYVRSNVDGEAASDVMLVTVD